MPSFSPLSVSVDFTDDDVADNDRSHSHLLDPEDEISPDNSYTDVVGKGEAYVHYSSSIKICPPRQGENLNAENAEMRLVATCVCMFYRSTGTLFIWTTCRVPRCLLSTQLYTPSPPASALEHYSVLVRGSVWSCLCTEEGVIYFIDVAWFLSVQNNHPRGLSSSQPFFSSSTSPTYSPLPPSSYSSYPQEENIVPTPDTPPTPSSKTSLLAPPHSLSNECPISKLNLSSCEGVLSLSNFDVAYPFFLIYSANMSRVEVVDQGGNLVLSSFPFGENISFMPLSLSSNLLESGIILLSYSRMNHSFSVSILRYNVFQEWTIRSLVQARTCPAGFQWDGSARATVVSDTRCGIQVVTRHIDLDARGEAIFFSLIDHDDTMSEVIQVPVRAHSNYLDNEGVLEVPDLDDNDDEYDAAELENNVDGSVAYGEWTIAHSNILFCTARIRKSTGKYHLYLLRYNLKAATGEWVKDRRIRLGSSESRTSVEQVSLMICQNTVWTMTPHSVNIVHFREKRLPAALRSLIMPYQTISTHRGLPRYPLLQTPDLPIDILVMARPSLLQEEIMSDFIDYLKEVRRKDGVPYLPRVRIVTELSPPEVYQQALCTGAVYLIPFRPLTSTVGNLEEAQEALRTVYSMHKCISQFPSRILIQLPVSDNAHQSVSTKEVKSQITLLKTQIRQSCYPYTSQHTIMKLSPASKWKEIRAVIKAHAKAVYRCRALALERFASDALNSKANRNAILPQ